jgi:hypothetical protein
MAAAAPCGGAGGVHPEVARFLAFARAKRPQHVRECVRLVDDAAPTARGDVFSGADVLDLLRSLRAGLERAVDEVHAARLRRGGAAAALAARPRCWVPGSGARTKCPHPSARMLPAGGR